MSTEPFETSTEQFETSTEQSEISTEPSEKSTDLSGIVGAYDVRGVAGLTLTEPVAAALGAGFVDLLLADGHAPELILAHDMRLSSPALAAAFAEGAVRRGGIVAATGLAATDQLYCASGRHRAAGAMVTASHNPPEDNGFKLCLPGAAPLSRDTGLDRIRRSAEAYLADGEIPVREGGRLEELETLDDYIATLLRLVPLPERTRGAGELRVVVDAADAMASLTVPALAEQVPGVRIIPLHFGLDGTFPHHPANPLDPRNLVDLQEAVRREHADLGLAFDGDADRCVVVDERGEPVPPSAITALIATREIARARAEGEETPAVVANLVSSRHVREAIDAAGGRRIRSRVGHSLIKALMAEHRAVFGGEHSAHYYFRDFFFADSGLLAALHVLAALLESGGTASELVSAHDPYAASGEINSRVADAAEALDRVRAHAASLPEASMDELDGLTIEHWDTGAEQARNWWAVVRASNTEPLLRLNVESAEVGTMERVRDELLRVIRDDGTADTPGPPADSAAAHADGGAEQPAGGSGAEIPAWVRERLRCPVCGAELRDVPQALRCEGCERVYPVTDGIAMLVAAD